MFHVRYILNELRRRMGRTILTAFGLAAGVGLIIGIVGVAQGLDTAQGQVLSPLKTIGTDILVTRVADATSTSATTATTQPGSNTGSNNAGGPSDGFFGGGPGGGGGGRNGNGQAALLNQKDAAALLSENSNVVTDLSKLGKPGDKFTQDFFLSATLISFPDSALSQVKKLDGVDSAVGGLTQLAEHETGTVPTIVAQVQAGGETLTSTVRPAPMTDQERAAFRQCLTNSGAIPATPSGGDQPGQGGGGGGFRGGGNDAGFQDCLPERFKEYQAQVVAPLRTIQQVVNPPSTDISNKTYTAAGIDPASSHAGLVTVDQLTAGRWLKTNAPNEILVSTAYANTNKLKVGSQIPINGQNYNIVGLVNPNLTGNTADIYFPLSTLQKLSNKQGRVTQILVKVGNASSVDKVAKEIKTALPGAQVVTTKQLANQVTGSLSNAKKLSDRLGTVLGIIVLAAAFIIVVLLTLSSVAKRVREIGTLRAIGWSKRRVVGQLMGETLGIGIIGGIIGSVLGVAATIAVTAFSPTFTATASGVPGLSGSSDSQFFGQSAKAVAKTVQVSVHAPVRPLTLLLGIGIAILGGLLAGAIGGWRAAKLSPATALRTVG